MSPRDIAMMARNEINQSRKPLQGTFNRTKRKSIGLNTTRNISPSKIVQSVLTEQDIIASKAPNLISNSSYRSLNQLKI